MLARVWSTCQAAAMGGERSDDGHEEWVTVYDRHRGVCTVSAAFAGSSAIGLPQQWATVTRDEPLSAPGGSFEVFVDAAVPSRVLQVVIALDVRGDPVEMHAEFEVATLGFPSLFPMSDHYLYPYRGSLWVHSVRPDRWIGAGREDAVGKAARRRPGRSPR
jgi:hypothetical protein